MTEKTVKPKKKGPSLAKQLTMKKTQELRYIQQLKVANMKVTYLERKLDSSRIWTLCACLTLVVCILMMYQWS
tara:strand:- start:525 stop:743 length:219 start_codon:yes stop_codon:yes gene_type:complete